MIFNRCKLSGAFIIDLVKLEDQRGFFGRAWCEHEFQDHGLEARMVQLNVGFSRARGTLRGMHYQRDPWGEAKLVRCTRGSIYDVIVDLRCSSPTYKEWIGIELSAENHRMLYVPAGCAHGYQTLVNDSETWYQTSQFYHPEAAHGVRFNDPAFGIKWPLDATVISEGDWSWPDFSGAGITKREAAHDHR